MKVETLEELKSICCNGQQKRFLLDGRSILIGYVSGTINPWYIVYSIDGSEEFLSSKKMLRFLQKGIEASLK
jgi:hypothetical protein